MFDRELSESGESIEAGSEQESKQELDEATHEPGARVENVGSPEKSEAVETAFTELVGTDRKITQTEPPEAAEEALKSAKKKTDSGDAATPINLPSPEKKAGKPGDKAEPDPKGAGDKVADDPKAESVEEGGEEPDRTVPLEATPITLPDKQSLEATPITLPSQESQPGEIPGELPQQARMGVEQQGFKVEGQGLSGPSIPGVEGLPEDDPLGQGGMGPDLGGESSELDDVMPNFQETIQAAQMEREPFDPGRIGGGPGSIHPSYGKSGQGMVSEDDDSSSEEEEEVVDHKKKMQEVYKAEMKLFEAINERDRAEKEYKENPSKETDAALETADGNYWQAVDDFNRLVSKNAEYNGEVRMPRPDGDEGEVEAPETEEDIKFSQEAVDPSMMHGGPHSSGIDHRKHQGVVSDPAEWQDPETPEGGIKTDRSINVDPAGDELGKEAEGRNE